VLDGVGDESHRPAQDQDQQQQAKPQADAAFPEQPGAEEEQQGKEQALPLKTGISQSKTDWLNDWLIKTEQASVERLQPVLGCQCSGSGKLKLNARGFLGPSDGRGVAVRA